MKPIVGFAVTGSFCTLHLSLKLMESLRERYDLVPIVSETVARTDTRFFTAAEYLEKVTAVCGRRPIASIVEADDAEFFYEDIKEYTDRAFPTWTVKLLDIDNEGAKIIK